ncbi:MAG TPA: hypothetical protein VFB41_04570 [Solirubrobacteraceae bacterium]|nr:hypothetical protein [Solirubrobacteraceae bacterium]
MRRAPFIVVALIVFVGISWVLARFFTTESTERGAVLVLLQAQARGDSEAMLDRLAPSCRDDARCRAGVIALAKRMRRSGDPKIIAYRSRTAYALGADTGLTRVAWTIVNRQLPVVQCVLVRRTGTALAGRRVSLLRVSAPIDNESDC